jgi:hypothetical protein
MHRTPEVKQLTTKSITSETSSWFGKRVSILIERDASMERAASVFEDCLAHCGAMYNELHPEKKKQVSSDFYPCLLQM